MKKKITAVALAVCILVVGIVGATMSYFTDKDTATNTFTFGEGVDIKLTESSINYDNGAGAAGGPEGAKLYGATNGTGLENYLTGGLTYDNVIPGRHYSKAPHVELVNSGKSDPAWIVVTATYPEGRPFNLGGQATVTDLLVTPNTTTDVDVTVEKVGNTYFYYFPNAVQPGTVVTPFQWMQLDPSVNNADTNAQSVPFNVEVKAYAVLAAGFNDCKTAFKAAFADVVGDMSDTQTNSATADENGAATFTVPAAPVNGSSTTVALTGLDVSTEYTLSATTYGIESAPASFQVVGNDGAIAAITVSLTDAQGAAATFNGEATITTYIAKNLENPQVIYSGTGAQPTFVSYDSTTGELVFKTTHFSTYIVTANVEAYNKTTNTAYKTLADAITAVNDGETVVLTKDVELANNLTIAKSMTLDGMLRTVISQKTITVTGKSVTVKNLTYREPTNANKNATCFYVKDGCEAFTATGCTFENPQWEVVQATSKDMKTLTISNNIFIASEVKAASDDHYQKTEDQATRYIHVQPKADDNVTVAITITGNTFKNMDKVKDSCVGIYYIADGSTLTLGGNTFGDWGEGDVVGDATGKLSIMWPEMNNLKAISEWTGAVKTVTLNTPAEN